jgi:hypothetical protein
MVIFLLWLVWALWAAICIIAHWSYAAACIPVLIWMAFILLGFDPHEPRGELRRRLERQKRQEDRERATLAERR